MVPAYAAGTGRFSDVPEAAWYAGAVGRAVSTGIAGRTSATTFSPGQKLTWTELADWLAAYADSIGIDAPGRADLIPASASAQGTPTRGEAAAAVIRFCFNFQVSGITYDGQPVNAATFPVQVYIWGRTGTDLAPTITDLVPENHLPSGTSQGKTAQWNWKGEQGDFMGAPAKSPAAAIADAMSGDEGGEPVNGLRLMALMGLCVKQGDTITVQVTGADEDRAAEELKRWMEQNL